jgi:hypothetical protein
VDLDISASPSALGPAVLRQSLSNQETAQQIPAIKASGSMGGQGDFNTAEEASRVQLPAANKATAMRPTRLVMVCSCYRQVFNPDR